ncbi:RagB/SusD family nutrient uptake outer membrane protein [Mucilaginibacter sp. UR6-1]|uniref:RagB/SusD family nutrient uptake outer membrane protein n=1 Tax=Mucilaginibacter sp. UR6-1 TaxID=1435643 RepID=UPI001E331FDE|nr:RagB/SusD family nutrient uptake outer membrane protein [Mucilaginibacter sp. UR6-1]MCC8407732.1 RagB/SusD family nutrient uptake outer membrane protein [Mucilaginibacter sp. UR6-1]
MKKINVDLIAGSIIKLMLCLSIPALFAGCKKYLDAKPDQSISTPSTIDDLEGLLDAYSTVNARYPSAPEVASDDYYLTAADFNGLNDAQRSYYSWQKSPNFVADYSSPYQGVEYANVILDALPKISGGDESARNKIRGNALFIRGSYHYAIAQVFAKPYSSSANSDLGIALRQTADAGVKPVRANLADTYTAIISDIKNSLPLLPSSSTLKYRASKPAAYGLLARVYLSMRDYKNAGLFADSALALYNTLINYNTLSATATLPFKQFNDEVIYDSRALGASALTQAKAKIDTLLYTSYASTDLRRTILFKTGTGSSFNFKGTYAGVTGTFLFNGIATDELYLIKAETAVRNGDTQNALIALNKLLMNRWKTGTFVPYAITDQTQLLNIVLKERRKELPFRTLRWSDLRRLNQEPAFARTLTRNLSGTTYTLEPNSLRYVFQIDQKAVDISGLQQNP